MWCLKNPLQLKCFRPEQSLVRILRQTAHSIGFNETRLARIESLTQVIIEWYSLANKCQVNSDVQGNKFWLKRERRADESAERFKDNHVP